MATERRSSSRRQIENDVSADDIDVSEKVKVISTFDSMGLREDLLRGIYAYGFEKPSAIQQRAIIPMSKGRDIIAQSQSGTGKTAVFCIGILQSLDMTTTDTQALVLSPTRELAEQSQKVMLALGDYMNVQCHACIGGKSIGEDIRRLDYGVQAISGTPGRVFDMIRRRHLRTRNIKMFVIDEADEMLNQGFESFISSFTFLVLLFHFHFFCELFLLLRFQGTDLRYLPILTSKCAGCSYICDPAPGSVGYD
jgi:ATP-dependent RNA helicase